jgi:hypothetical protein
MPNEKDEGTPKGPPHDPPGPPDPKPGPPNPKPGPPQPPDHGKPRRHG